MGIRFLDATIQVQPQRVFRPWWWVLLNMTGVPCQICGFPHHCETLLFWVSISYPSAGMTVSFRPCQVSSAIVTSKGHFVLICQSDTSLDTHNYKLNFLEDQEAVKDIILACLKWGVPPFMSKQGQWWLTGGFRGGDSPRHQTHYRWLKKKHEKHHRCP